MSCTACFIPEDSSFRTHLLGPIFDRTTAQGYKQRNEASFSFCEFFKVCLQLSQMSVCVPYSHHLSAISEQTQMQT